MAYGFYCGVALSYTIIFDFAPGSAIVAKTTKNHDAMKKFPFVNISPLVLNYKDFQTMLAIEDASIKEGSVSENADKTVNFVIVASDGNNLDFHKFVTDCDTLCCQSQRV